MADGAEPREMLPHIPTAVNAGADGLSSAAPHTHTAYARPASSASSQAHSRPQSAMSGMSLGSTSGATPRVNPYLQGLRPTTPLQSAAGGGARATTSVALAMAFRPPSPVLLDPHTGTVAITRFSRPQSAASDDTNWSQQPLAQARKELMNPRAVKLTPIGPVFDDDLSDGSDDSMMMHSDDEKEVIEFYLDAILDDPVPFEEAELEDVTPSESSEEEEEKASSRSSSPEPVQEVEPEEVSSDDEHEVSTHAGRAAPFRHLILL